MSRITAKEYRLIRNLLISEAPQRLTMEQKNEVYDLMAKVQKRLERAEEIESVGIPSKEIESVGSEGEK